MSVYVDCAFIRYRGMHMSHMIADTIEELHEMADSIGVKRKWFQDKASFPHYDICKKMRMKAITLGARSVEQKELVKIIRALRKQNE